MKKRIKVILKTKEDTTSLEISAIVHENSIRYQDELCQIRIDIQGYCVTMERKNVQYTIFFHFEENHTYGRIKIENHNLDLDIQLKKLELEPSKIHILYEWNHEEYDYCIYY